MAIKAEPVTFDDITSTKVDGAISIGRNDVALTVTTAAQIAMPLLGTFAIQTGNGGFIPRFMTRPVCPRRRNSSQGNVS